MPETRRGGRESPQEETRRKEREDQREDEPIEQTGDILGISHSTAKIPQASSDHGGNPEGVEVRRKVPGTEDLKPGKGATAIDMGAGGEGHDVDRDT